MLVGLASGAAVVSDRQEPTPGSASLGPVVVVIGSVGAAADSAGARALAGEVLGSRPGAAAREVRLFVPSHGEPDFRELAARADGPTWVRPGKRLFAMPVSAVQALPPPRSAERVRVERAADLGFYDEYARHYGRWHREAPGLARHVRVEPREALARHLADGLLFLVVIDGRIGGVMACFGDWCERGLWGYRMAEEFLYPDFRGQGLAAAVQRRYIDALDGSGGRAVFGWIHPLNAPSIRTATRVGRIDVGGYFYVRPNG